eukprot:182959_1
MANIINLSLIILIIQVIVCELADTTHKVASYNKWEVSVLTFNVLEGKRTRNNETFGGKVRELLAESRPDILLFQEVNVHDNNVGDRSSSPMPFYGRHFQMFGDKEKGFIVQSVDRAEIELYFHIQSCAAERFPMLGNSIFASNSYLQRLAAEDLYQVVDSRTVVNITGSCTVPRCAAYALFGDGVSVVSVHLCGGRFDDAKILDTDESSYAVKQRTQVAKAKDKGLKELFAIKSSKPTIIGGDFNGIRNKELVQSALSSYGRYQTADEGNKKIFEDFYTSGFDVLKANDYAACYDESIGRTTDMSSAMVDWIFVDTRVCPDNDGIANTVQTFNKRFTVSDHAAIYVKIPLDRSKLTPHHKQRKKPNVQEHMYYNNNSCGHGMFNCVHIAARYRFRF